MEFMVLVGWCFVKAATWETTNGIFAYRGSPILFSILFAYEVNLIQNNDCPIFARFGFSARTPRCRWLWRVTWVMA